MTRKFLAYSALGIAFIALIVFFRFWSGSTHWLWSVSHGGQSLLPLVVVASLIDSINPCSFSVFLVTLAFLYSLGRMRSQILLVGAVYILGIFLAYFAIGLGLIQALHFFNTPHFMGKLGAILMIVFGAFNVVAIYFPRFPIRLEIPHSVHKPLSRLINHASLPTALLLGILVGLCEFPCTGGPYLMILGLLHDHQTYSKGVMYLFLYNIIFVLPLIVLLLLSTEALMLERIQIWQKHNKREMRLWGSIALIILGIVLVLGWI